MFSKKPKQEPINAPKRKGADLMNQMGFGGMEDMEAMIYGDDDDDDLEAELAALAGDDAQPKKSSPKRKAPVDLSLIEKMAAQSVQDLSDEDVSDTEDPELLAELEEIDDEEPPTSHGNVTALQPTFAANTQHRSPTIQGSPSPSTSRQNTDQGINVVAVLQDRTSMYQQALVKARDTGDGTKQRRLERGLKTLAELTQKARAGKPVGEEDIPPPVAITTSNSITSPSASTSAAPMTPQITPPQVTKPQPSPVRKSPVPDYDADEPVRQPVNGAPVMQRATPSTSDKDTHHILETRRDQYKNAALAAKKTGDMATATKYVRIAKQFDIVIAALDEGKPVDLSNIPPPPPANLIGLSVQTTARPVTEVIAQRSPLQATGEKGGAAEEIELPPEPTEEEAKRLFQAPDTPKNVMEALTQRLEKYKSSEEAAKTAGDSGKSRRMGRIVKQYEDAIKMYRAGKPVDFDELPTPPGFGPIPKDTGPPPKVSAASPSQSSTQPTPSPRSQGVVVSGGASSAVSPQPKPAPKPQAAAAQKTAVSSASGGAVKSSLSSSSVDPVGHQINRTSISRKSTSSRQEQQLGFLKERMEEFRSAALQAKKNKDLELAKQYIRMMKGMEPMVEALESGLPVDLSQVPPSPLANEDNEDKYVVVSAEDYTPTGDRDEIFTQLEEDLKTQIQTCVTNAQHFTKLGDVPAAAKFQKLEQGCRKDLDSLRSAKRHGDPVPKFHYETRSFSVVQSNTDLGETDMELNIIRGISYNLPSGYSEKDMDTMVKYEFAFPSVEEQQTGQSKTVKNTCNPEYGDVFKLQINRKSHGLARVVERKGIKLDVYIKRGFLKADKFLGTATVKLTPLETKCTFHDSFDLMEGRKAVGGKLEVKVRVRDPFKSRQVDEVKEKWLVIDQFIRTLGSKSRAAPVAPGGQKTKNEGTTCMEVLRYEAQMLDKQISYLKDSLSAIQMQTLRHKRALLDEKLEMQQKQLREGGREAWIAYIAVVEKEVISFEEEAHQLTRIGDVQKAETMMNKSKHAKKELTAIKTKFPDLVGTVARP